MGKRGKDSAAATTVTATTATATKTTYTATGTPNTTVVKPTSDQNNNNSNSNSNSNKNKKTTITTARVPSSEQLSEDFKTLCAELLTPGKAKVTASSEVVTRLTTAFTAFGAAIRKEGLEKGRQEGREEEKKRHSCGMDVVERMTYRLEKIEAAMTKITTMPGTTETTKASTWAAVTAGGMVAPKVIPARNTREIHVFAPDAAPDVVNRTAQQTVQAINTASGTSTAIAARKLPSGRIAITFTDSAEAAAKVTGLGSVRLLARQSGRCDRKRQYL